MRIYVLAITFFSVLTAAASNLGADSTWQDLTDAGYEFQMPRIWFGNVGVSAVNTCFDDEQIKTIRPVNICVEQSQKNLNSKCLKYESIQFSKSKYLSTRVCRRYAAQHECVSWEDKQTELTAAYKIPVYSKGRADNGRKDHEQHILFFKVLTIESCHE